jgi:peptide deformylase
MDGIDAKNRSLENIALRRKKIFEIYKLDRQTLAVGRLVDKPFLWRRVRSSQIGVPSIKRLSNLTPIFQENDLEIIKYPHPALRHKSKAVRRVDRQLKAIVRQMFDLMYDARGIGLAANQVGLPLQLFIVNVTGEKGSGEELVVVNPVVHSPKGIEEAEEGCLSLPGIHGQIARPTEVRLTGYELSGGEINMVVDGLLARVAQHESDHLDGVLFIDRMSPTSLKLIQNDLEELELEFRHYRTIGKIPADEIVRRRLSELEAEYCN